MKRKIFTFIIVSLFHCFIVAPIFAQEKINDFKADVVINHDGTVNIVETVNYDFDNLSRHGIYRTIPFVKTNQDGKKYQLDLQVISVENENKRAYQYQILKEGENLKIKIGDPNRTITGVHTYVISYKVSGALTYFSDHDEFYWNVTGNDWQVPIEKASATVNLPQGVKCYAEFVTVSDENYLKRAKEGNCKVICYFGPLGSRKRCVVQELTTTSFKVESLESLNAYSGLTFAVSFPKEIVAVLEPKEYGKKTIFDILLRILIVLGGFLWYFVAPFFFIFLWYKYGRDPNVGRAVTATYDPPKDKTGRFLTPAEVGTLVDEKADQRDLTATIVSLAIRGYLKIKEETKKVLLFENKDYTLIKKKEWRGDSSLQSHERLILEKLFRSRDEISTSSLKDNFYRTFEKFQNDLYEKVVSLGFFPENPESVRKKYIIFGVLAFFTANIPLTLLLFLLGQAMPRKTLDGAKAKIQAIGLKNFLVTQERQLEFQVKNWFMFEKLLPYAIVFGVEKIWAERFADLEIKPPDWYEGDYGRTFNTVYFTNSLANSLTSMNSMTMSPTRSSSGFSSGFSGGGGSGGGGGGGGGGSW